MAAETSLGTRIARRLEAYSMLGLRGLLVLLVLFAAVPLVSSKLLLWGNILIFAMFALSYNLLLGYAGQFSFGHAAFYATGAYLGIALIELWGLSLIPVLTAVLAVTVMMSVLMGAVAFRRRGLYFAMITLALAEIVHQFVANAEVTGGANGMRLTDRSIPLVADIVIIPFSDVLLNYYIILGVVVVVAFALRRIVDSPFGLTIRTIRENEQRSRHVGYNTTPILIAVFALSGALTGVAGLLNALLIGFADPSYAHWGTMGEVLEMTIVGGLQTFVGPVLGAIALGLSEEWIVGFLDAPKLYLGLVLIFVVVFLPQGIGGWMSDRF